VNIEGNKIAEFKLDKLTVDFSHILSICEEVFGKQFSTMGSFKTILVSNEKIESKFSEKEFEVLLLACSLHGTTQRKTGKQLYANHVIRTAIHAKVRYPESKLLPVIMLLHDVIEDCDITRVTLLQKLKSMNLGYSKSELIEVIRTTWELTNQYTKSKFPGLNKAARNVRESQRLSMSSVLTQKGKSLDIYDNTSDITELGDYAKQYLEGKKYTIEYFVKNNPEVFNWISVELASK
jgi:hypothetical protein